MKRTLLSLITAVSIPLLSNAGTVTINYAQDSIWGVLCPTPQTIDFLIGGNTTGYIVGTDSVDIYIDFGDGQDTTFKVEIWPQFYGWCTHTYTLSGQFSVTYIATGPDLAADTVIVYNEVLIGDTCGNIEGQVYLDANNDCVYNAGDTPLQGIQVKLTLNNQAVAWDWTDASGNYWFTAPTNFSYEIELANIAQYGYSVVCPAAGNYPNVQPPSVGHDFALQCTPGFDLVSHLWGWSATGDTTPVNLYVYNASCQPTSGIAKLVLDDPKLYYAGYSNPAPAYVNGDTIAYNFANLYNAWGNSFHAWLWIGTDTTAQVGDTVCMTLIAEPIAGDNTPANNVKNHCIPVLASWDPNDKQVSPTGVGSQGKIAPNTEMAYTINFQNTGTYTAYNIYILDTLDDVTLDLNAIQVLGASHPVAVDIIGANNNVLKFRFDDINLPDSTTNEPGSHGWVIYKIKQQPNLSNGTQIMNTAGIFFDWNPPVITNTTLNTIDLGLVSVEPVSIHSSHLVRLYPNPTNDVLNVQFLNAPNGGNIVLFDLAGRMVLSRSVAQSVESIDVTALPSGMYSLVLSDGFNMERHKVVVAR